MSDAILETTLSAFLIDMEGQPHGERDVWLTWTAENPLAICLSIEGPNGVVDWEFSRELLCSGLAGPAGIGDLRVAPCYGYGESGHEELEVRLYEPPELRKCLRLIFEHSDILRFLLDTDAEYRDAEREYLNLFGELLDSGWPA